MSPLLIRDVPLDSLAWVLLFILCLSPWNSTAKEEVRGRSGSCWKWP